MVCCLRRISFSCARRSCSLVTSSRRCSSCSFSVRSVVASDLVDSRRCSTCPTCVTCRAPARIAHEEACSGGKQDGNDGDHPAHGAGQSH